MIVLGISETHCATAAILRDGAIIGCASEERFTRLKNDAGYPRLAIDALLRELGLRGNQIDLVALAGRRAYAREWMNRVLHDAAYAREYYGVRLQDRAAGWAGGRASWERGWA
jgi:predicted NodU family carbamoyl transferase